MKLFLGLCALLSMGAFAQNSVVLDSSRFVLDSNFVTLEKIDLTPNVVELMVPVPTTVQMCEPGYQRTETRANGAECGYRMDTSHCSVYRGPRGPRGPRYNPPRRGPRHRGGVIVRRRAPVCVPVSVPRVCSYSVCDRPYMVTEERMKNFTVTFENYDKDEAFDFSLNQNGDVVLLPTITSPGCTSLVTYGDKPFVTGAKISLKTGWWNRGCR